MLAIFRDRLTPEYIAKMYIKAQIQALAKFIYDPTGKKYNCDITISLAEMELADKEFEYLAVKENKSTEIKEQGFRGFKKVNGVLREVYS